MPIKQVLAKPKKSGRIAKWAIRLGEHEIEFKGGNSIKGQILANFLAETSPTEREEEKNGEAKRKEPEPENTWKLFTDGASSSDGSGAGLMLVNPKGKEYTYALSYSIKHIKREQNKKAYALSKLASMTFSKLVKEVLVEVIQTKSVAEKEITDVIKEDEDRWMVPIREYLKEEILPKDPQKARKLRIKDSLYMMIEERLYRRSYMSPWLRSPTNSAGGCKASDNGKQFTEGTFPVFCKKLGTLQAFTSVYHPQENGQVEVTNREIIKGMERRLGIAHQAWVDELPQVLWAHRTTPNASKAEYQGKMRPTWEGPYRVRKAYGDGAYKLETLSGEAIDRT
ncbi:reverse transcriptase domain-containing protein [Tanacetum coccineum]